MNLKIHRFSARSMQKFNDNKIKNWKCTILNNVFIEQEEEEKKKKMIKPQNLIFVYDSNSNDQH